MFGLDVKDSLYSRFVQLFRTDRALSIIKSIAKGMLWSDEKSRLVLALQARMLDGAKQDNSAAKIEDRDDDYALLDACSDTEDAADIGVKITHTAFFKGEPDCGSTTDVRVVDYQEVANVQAIAKRREEQDIIQTSRSTMLLVSANERKYARLTILLL
jgi:hypothetical protein